MSLRSRRQGLLIKLAATEARGDSLRRDLCNQLDKMERGLEITRWALALLPLFSLLQGGRSGKN